MKLTVTQENLNKALQVVGRVASGKTPLPVLNNILFKAEQNRLLLAATNLEIAITQYIGTKIESEGSVTVPARLMSEFVNNLPKGPVELEADGSKLRVSMGKYKSVIHGMTADEFPSLPKIEEKQSFVIAGPLLKRAVQQTVVVASHDDTRPVLTGVYFHSHEGMIYIAATDGYRLAERALMTTDAEIEAIIPSQTLQDVLRVMSDDTAEVKLLFDDNQVRILLDDIEITSRLIDGSFPDYRQLIPATTDITVTVDKAEFVRVTKVASLFAKESGGSVTLNASAEAGTVSIHSVASQLGENTSEATASVSGDGQVTLNSRYLLEGLACIDSEQIDFTFSGKLSPCVLKATNGDEQNYKHIVMPLKS